MIFCFDRRSSLYEKHVVPARPSRYKNGSRRLSLTSTETFPLCGEALDKLTSVKSLQPQSKSCVADETRRMSMPIGFTKETGTEFARKQSAFTENLMRGGKRVAICNADDSLAPVTSSSLPSSTHISSSQLTLIETKHGEFVELLARVDIDWWQVRNADGIEGLVPAGFVTEIVQSQYL